MSNKIADRIGVVELSSETNLQAREQTADLYRSFRWLCAEHVRLFGFDIAMWLLWQKPLPKRDHRIKIARRYHLYAKALDGVTVSRAFYPAKYPGYCYICKHNCLTVNCAITRWGTGWARYECWYEELRRIDSHEFHRREFLSDAKQGPDDGHYLGGAFQKTNHMTWEELSNKIAGKASEPKKEVDTILGMPVVTISTVGEPDGSLTIPFISFEDIESMTDNL